MYRCAYKRKIQKGAIYFVALIILIIRKYHSITLS